MEDFVEKWEKKSEGKLNKDEQKELAEDIKEISKKYNPQTISKKDITKNQEEEIEKLARRMRPIMRSVNFSDLRDEMEDDDEEE